MSAKETDVNTDALTIPDIKSLADKSVKRAILSADELPISKSERDKLVRKAKTMIALGHEIVNVLEGLK